MALEPITRQEKIIAGQDLTPITRMEKFLKQFGGGGGGSIPKPLTYDYMPEGYPSKSIEYVTLMGEQEVAFSEQGGLMVANSPVNLEIKLGDKLTVVWDGVSYDVEVTKVAYGPRDMLVFGNVGLAFPEDKTDYPFMYTESAEAGTSQWITSDTTTSHTIKVMRQQVTITPMSTDFIPKNLNVVFKKESGSTPVNCNVTYNELRDWVERDVPVFAVFIDAANSQYNIYNITKTALLTDMLGFVYYISDSSGSISKSFVYKSDGTIEIQPT